MSKNTAFSKTTNWKRNNYNLTSYNLDIRLKGIVYHVLQTHHASQFSVEKTANIRDAM